jgi:eukaryotic-like serine/threonine-protein kinase
VVDPDWQGYFWNPSLSPDGTQLAVARPNCCGGSDIWVKRLDRGPIVRISLDRATGMYPTWASDGRSVTFSDSVAGALNLWNKRADGSGQPVLQFHSKRFLQNAHWSPDGRWLIFVASGVSGSLDIRAMRPGLDTASIPLVATRFLEASPALSPDGKWLAYTSNETGSYEVYVVPFPNTGAAKFAVSAHGGKEPSWSRNGRELFYLDGSANLVAVEVKSAPAFSIGRSTTLFSMGGFRSQTLTPEYAVSPDGRRFLMIRSARSNTPDKLVVVENWFEEVARKEAH